MVQSIRKFKDVIANNCFMLRYIARCNKIYFLLCAAMIIFNGVETYINLYFIQWIYRAIENKSEFTQVFAVIGLSSITLFSVYILEKYVQKVIRPKIVTKISAHIYMDVLEKNPEIDLQCYENAGFYDTYTRALSETEGRAFAVVDTIINFLSALVNVSIIVTYVAMLDPIFLIFGILATLSIFLPGFINAKLIFKERKERTTWDRKTGYVKRIAYESLWAKELKLYPSVLDILQGNYNEACENVASIQVKYGKRFMAINSVFILSQLLFSTALPWWVLSYKAITDSLSIAAVASIANALIRFPSILNSLFVIFPQLYQHSLYITHLREMLNYQSVTFVKNDIVMKEDSPTLSIENVSFAYDGNEANTINGISLSIPWGSKIALVGANGAGKTTFIKLLLKLYNVTEGAIYIDHHNINEIDTVSYRNMFGVCFQDYQIYAHTIAENVLMRRITCSEDEHIVWNALEKVGLQEKVQNLENGIHTILTKEFDSNGVYFSGGETQKLVLARAFASNNKFLILDEPSSALDPIAEYELNKLIVEATKDKTVIFISHRLSTTVHADRIYLFKNGVIIEEGSHTQLMKQNGEYANMFHAQASEYIKKETGAV